MTKEKAKELAKILLAYSEGKTIQKYNWLYICEGRYEQGWEDIKDLKYDELTFTMRIKPEKKLVPFTFEDRDLFKDKWIVFKNCRTINKISRVGPVKIGVNLISYTYEQAFENFTFEDGSVFGKYIEE